MCIIVFAHKVLKDYPLVLLSNRDEEYARATTPVQHWHNKTGIIAGKDLQAGGTWLGHNTHQQWAAITNYRDPTRQDDNKRSRGLIITDYLQSKQTAGIFCESLSKEFSNYNHFNGLIADDHDLFYVSSRLQSLQKLSPGIYVLSNAHLDTPWPKAEALKKSFSTAIDQGLDETTLWPLLLDETKAPSDSLPSTGVSPELESALSSIFINLKNYGTRASYLMTINHESKIILQEKIHPQKAKL